MSTPAARNFRVKCPHCDEVLRVDPDAPLRLCPACGGKVRLPAGRPGHHSAERQRGAEEDQVPVVCDLCDTRIYVAREMIGQTVRCPDCHRTNTVKRPPKPKGPSRPDLQDVPDDYFAPSGAVDDVVRSAHARELLAAARKDLQREEEQRTRHLRNRDPSDRDASRTDQGDATRGEWDDDFDDTPGARQKRIVFHRTQNRPHLQFLFNSSVWPQWVGMIVALYALWIGGIVYMQTFSGVLGGDVMTVFFVLGMPALLALLGGFIASRLFDVIEMTANEAEGPEIEWQDIDLIGRSGRMMFFINSIVLSAIPGWLIGQMLDARIVGALVSIFFLFPPILLSMLDEGSFMIPWSPRIWRSCGSRIGAWLIFYLKYCSAYLAVTLTWHFVGNEANPVSCLILSAVTVFVFWIVSRWLGDLAGVCVEVEAGQSGAPDAETA